MSTSCEGFARKILPIYRSMVAKELVTNYNYTQQQAAKKLGTTQAAISQYINSKRGYKNVPNYEEILPAIQKAAVEVAARIASAQMDTEEFSNSFCELCTSLRRKRKLA